MNNIDTNVTAYQLGPITIMRDAATPTHKVAHPECFGRFTVIALSPATAIRKCMRRVAQMCAKHSACERLEFLEPHLPALEEPANIGDNRKES